MTESTEQPQETMAEQIFQGLVHDLESMKEALKSRVNLLNEEQQQELIKKLEELKGIVD